MNALPKAQHESVMRFWNTLCSRYKEQVDPERAAKRATTKEKSAQNMRDDRVSTPRHREAGVLTFGNVQLATALLTVAADLEKELAEKYGAAQVSGFSKLIDADWLDSTFADHGNVPETVWNARKVAMGGGKQQPGLEVRPKRWKSENVSK
jgi:hypothetical protein